MLNMAYEVNPICGGPNLVEISNVCPMCGKTHSFKIEAKVFDDGLALYNGGALVQKAWPTLTPSQRELMISGICDDCWNNM